MSSAPLNPIGLPPVQANTRPGTAGMLTFLAGVTVLFGALLIAWMVTRSGMRFPPPALPWIFWIATGAVLVSSVFLNYAVQSAKAGRGDAAHRGLLCGTGFAYLFLGLQGAGLVMLGQMHLAWQAVNTTLYTILLLLIALHLAHVIGGVVYLSYASLRSERHHYTDGDIGQLRPMVIFWHYMAVLWVILFTVLVVVR